MNDSELPEAMPSGTPSPIDIRRRHRRFTADGLLHWLTIWLIVSGWHAGFAWWMVELELDRPVKRKQSSWELYSGPPNPPPVITEPDEALTGQVVAPALMPSAFPSPDARYLSAWNQVVEKETRAPAPPAAAITPAPVPAAPAPPSHAAPQPSASPEVAKAPSKTPKRAKAGARDGAPKPRPVLNPSEAGPKGGHSAAGPGEEVAAAAGEADPDLPPAGEGTGGAGDGGGVVKGPFRTGILSPSTNRDAALANMDTLLRSGAGSVYDVEEEDAETVLNSRRFQHWDFFYRVQERVRVVWQPSPVIEQSDPTGRIYGVKDRLTVLIVVLDKDGKVQTLRLKRDSGLPALDREAKRAVMAAAPYSNVPDKLLDETGTLKFEFSFYVERTGGRLRLSPPRRMR